MRRLFLTACWLLWIVLTVQVEAGNPACVPFSEAGKYIGSHKCVRGKVVHVEAGDKGVHFVDFCEDHARCPFSCLPATYDTWEISAILRGGRLRSTATSRNTTGTARSFWRGLGSCKATRRASRACRKITTWSGAGTTALGSSASLKRLLLTKRRKLRLRRP